MKPEEAIRRFAEASRHLDNAEVYADKTGNAFHALNALRKAQVKYREAGRALLVALADEGKEQADV